MKEITTVITATLTCVTIFQNDTDADKYVKNIQDEAMQCELADLIKHELGVNNVTVLDVQAFVKEAEKTEEEQPNE